VAPPRLVLEVVVARRSQVLVRVGWPAPVAVVVVIPRFLVLILEFVMVVLVSIARPPLKMPRFLLVPVTVVASLLVLVIFCALRKFHLDWPLIERTFAVHLLDRLIGIPIASVLHVGKAPRVASGMVLNHVDLAYVPI